MTNSPDVYLDNSATTKVFPEAIKEMNNVMEEIYANPSSLHRRGKEAERILTSARQNVAELLGVKSQDIIFTSGGTESNNMAVLGTARRLRKRGKHVITTSIEHSSILQPFEILSKEGFDVTHIQPDKDGLIDPLEVNKAVREDTILVSIMHINNEIGSIQPLSHISTAIKNKKPGCIFHVDAVQSFTKLPLFPEEQGIDSLSISAHKFHGPKGVGALYLNNNVLLEPLFYGGGHERELRPGTENTPGIAGMSLAAKLSFENRKNNINRLYNLKEKLISYVTEKHPFTRVNGPTGDKGAPHIINLSFPSLKGEILQHALEDLNIYVSTGSACHAKSKNSEPSHVLQALGLDQAAMDGAIRISLSIMNTEEDIEYTAEKIVDSVKELKVLI